MKINWGWPKKPAPAEDRRVDHGTLVDAPVGESEPIANATQVVTAKLSTKAVSLGLGACLVCGPLALVAAGLAYMQPAPTAQATTHTSPVADPDEQATAAAHAQRVVRAWLTATRAESTELESLVAGVQTSTLPENPATVVDTTTAGITQDADGVWTVTVSTGIHTDAGVSREYFAVPVQVGAGRSVVALTLPTPVPAPALAQSPGTAYPETIATSTPAGQTLAQFLGAYLVGSGDVSRYVTPGSPVRAIAPAPYTQVTLTTVRVDRKVPETPGDGQVVRVLVSATAFRGENAPTPITVAATLTARAGRWEITAIDPAPALSEDASTPTALPAPQPTTSSTTPAPLPAASH